MSSDNAPTNTTHGAAYAAPFFSTTPRNIMQFATHNTAPNITEESIGTSTQGSVTATFGELVKLFGHPITYETGKVDAEWNIKFADGTFATIYNYKNGQAYLGEDGLPVKEIKEWHIGGSTRTSADRVQIALDLSREAATDAKPKSKLDEAFESAVEIMESLKATRGENYAKAVEVALMVRKQGELVNMLASTVVKIADMPEPVGQLMLDMNNQMGAKIIARFVRVAIPDIANMQETAEEIMGWVDRMMEAESSGVKTMLKETE